MSTNVFDRVSSLVEEIGNEKQAAAKAAMDDPGGQDGASSHPSATSDSSELPQPAPEGEQSSSNESVVKEQTPLVPDNDPELTPEAAPKQDEVQLGQGVDKAKATGEDPSTEEDYKGDKEDPPEQGNKDMGGTSHPASGDIGEKYSSVTRESVAAMSDANLFKLAAALGNDVNAVLANSFFNEDKAADLKGDQHELDTDNDGKIEGSDFSAIRKKKKKSDKSSDENSEDKAAAAGYAAADEADTFAAAIIGETVKAAHHQADLVADYMSRISSDLRKQAEGVPMDDTLGGEGNGEAHGTEVPAPADGGGEAILAAMAGGGEEQMPVEDPLAAAGVGPEGMGPEGMGPEGMGPEGVPTELAGMDEEAALQQLASALQEAGISPEELAAAGMAGGEGAEVAPKLAAAVDNLQRSGKYEITEAKRGTSERKVRDYMKGYVNELCARSRR